MMRSIYYSFGEKVCDVCVCVMACFSQKKIWVSQILEKRNYFLNSIPKSTVYDHMIRRLFFQQSVRVSTLFSRVRSTS